MRIAVLPVCAVLTLGCGDDPSGSGASSPSGAGASGPTSSGAGASSTGGASGSGGPGGAAVGGGGEGGSGISGDLKAFPDAEGFGTETPGGRGGKVYVVDTLSDDGPGSLRQALMATEPRIVVFRVSGVIALESDLMLADANSYVTVAGQTSPGGITIGGPGTLGSYQENFHDGVFRFLRFRGQGKYDNVSFNDVHHLVFDHCDFSGAIDETFDVTYGSDFTVQWSSITNSETDGQNYGALIAYAPTSNISIHHTLSAHHAGRCAPQFHWGGGGPPAGGAVVDYRNNVIYNCSFDTPLYAEDDPSGTYHFNLVGNVFELGPDSDTGCCGMFRLPDTSDVYETDNTYGPLPVWAYAPPTLLSAAYPVPAVSTHSSSELLDQVLSKVGAFPRDAMNERTIDEVKSGTGSLGKIDDPLIESGPEPPADQDLDGMADAWESAEGLDPADPGDAVLDADGDGYTNIEEYIGQLAEQLTP